MLKEALHEKLNELLVNYLLVLLVVLLVHKYTYYGIYVFCFYLGCVTVDFTRFTIAYVRLLKVIGDENGQE